MSDLDDQLRARIAAAEARTERVTREIAHRERAARRQTGTSSPSVGRRRPLGETSSSAPSAARRQTPAHRPRRSRSRANAVAHPTLRLSSGAVLVMAHSRVWDSGFWTWGGWSFFVAVGTLGLAFFTWRAVRKSSEQIKLQTLEVESSRSRRPRSRTDGGGDSPDEYSY